MPNKPTPPPNSGSGRVLKPDSAEYQSYKSKIIQDALSKTKFRPKVQTAGDALMFKAMDVTNKVRDQVRPILMAGGGFDKEALRATVFTLYLQAFESAFSKEELANICTILHSEIMLETIEADPWGKDKPDLMSGL